MNTKKCAVSAAVAAVLGTASIGFSSSVQSGIIPDGQYQLQVIPTPTKTTTYGATTFRILSGGGVVLESSFTFGSLPSNSGSQGMADNGAVIDDPLDVGPGASRGSGIGGDGFVGVLDITVSGDAVTVQSFSVDLIEGTAGGNFVQDLDVDLNPLMPFDPLPAPTTANMFGSIDASGNMTLVLTGRMGTIDGPLTAIADRRWNVDGREPTTVNVGGLAVVVPPASAPWAGFTTGTSLEASGLTGTIKSITGVPFVSAGDLNSDGFTDFTGTLVTGGEVGADWETFKGATYFEVWRINIVSVSVGGDLSPVVAPTGVQAAATVVATVSNAGGDGTVVVSANATDPNGVVAGYAWTVTSPASCATVVGGATNPTVELDPSGCAVDDIVTAAVAVSDSALPSVNASVTYRVAAGVVVDADADGVPDALDSSLNDASLLQNSIVVSEGDLQVSAPGTFELGRTALCAETSGALVAEADITAFGGDGCVAPASSAVDTVANVGGIFDFTVRVASAGDTAMIVLPLTAPIPTNAAYRKYRQATGWSDFLAVGNDVFGSAAGAPGNCPVPGAAEYTTNAGNLVQGHNCVQLSITDGSPNDADGMLNGVITDPGGVGGVIAAAPPTNNSQQDSFESNGCTISSYQPSLGGRFDWAILAGFIAWIGGVSLRRRKRVAK